MRDQEAAARHADVYVRVPDHVADRDGRVWRVVRDGGMVTRADYDGIVTCGIKYAEDAVGPLRPVYVNGGPDGLAVESAHPLSEEHPMTATDLPEGVTDTFTFTCECGATVHVAAGTRQPHDCPLTEAERQAIRDTAAEAFDGT